MKWKSNVLFISRAIISLGIVVTTFYCIRKQLFPPPFNKIWVTESAWICGFACIYIFVRRKSGILPVLYKTKVLVMLGLTSCLFYQWMTSPEFKQTPIVLIGLLLAITMSILNLMDAIWLVKEKYYIALSIACGVLSLVVIPIGIITKFYQLVILGTVFIIASLSDIMVKQFLLRGGNENE